jgi:Protein of unknown function (DUF1203)
MTSTCEYVLSPITAAAADALRAADGPVYVADSYPGYPCRQCLRDAQVGEEVVLVSHDPFDVDSPYRSASPIFLHLERCERAIPTDVLPTQLTSRQLSVRSFDSAAMMIDASVIEGPELDATVTRLLKADVVSTIHVHNAVRGCWATNIVRRK